MDSIVRSIGSADTIHLIDKTNAWNTIAIRLTPDSLALRLHALDSIKDNNAAIQHTQGALNFSGKVNMAGSINEY